MSNIAALLKQEITRLVRKELKGETAALKKTNARYRADIAELKRRLALFEQQLKSLGRERHKAAPVAAPSADTAVKMRFRPAGLKKHRERLGLSAAVLGSILGVSTQTVYNWEAGSSRPGKDHLAKIASLRKMGKRAVQTLIDAQATPVPGD